jgi:hypothetical protein
MHLPARNSDPFTSREAAEFMADKRAAQQAITAKAVEQYPGLTSLELSRRARVDRYTLARRLSECEEVGMVRRGQARRCSVSGRTALTWYPPGEAEQLVLPMRRVA